MNRIATTLCCVLSLALPPQAVHASGAPELKISYALASASAAPADPADPNQSDLWSRIRAGFSLPESDPQLTRVHEAWYTGHAAYLARAIQRSRPYLFHIVEEVEKRGMPMEIALLPMIESAYNPMALSPQKASGIWQFIPATGRIYGLQQNAWYDGRRDILQATQAALDYLARLHQMFGDWELALAAYNCGEGCVARAQSRNGGGGYAGIKLPTETRHYVPKLIAVRNILQDPQRFGLNVDSIANEPYFMQVNLSRPMEARSAARLAEMDLEEFLSLNPAFQRRVIHTDTRGVLLLPADRVETFQFNLHRQGKDKGLQSYQARRGEKASGIAAKFGVTLEWLKEHNPLNLYRGKVAQPQTLLVPMAGKGETKPALATGKPLKTAAAGKPAMRTHRVRKGDTLSRVAKLYKVKVADIRRWNQDAEVLKPGTLLAIPATAG